MSLLHFVQGLGPGVHYSQNQCEVLHLKGGINCVPSPSCTNTESRSLGHALHWRFSCLLQEDEILLAAHLC
jgi:hypothetical protein